MGPLLAAADVVVPDEALAAVDAIVSPGETVNPADNG
jgi:hypothetical protein